MQFMRRGSGHSGTQNPIVFYLSVLLHAFLAALVCAAAFAPLSALFVFEKGSALKYLALLCPLLLVLVVLPLRFSFAQALSERSHAKPFSLKTAFSFSLYGEKVAEGFLYLLHLLKWAAPLLALSGTLYVMLFSAEVFTQPVVDITALGRAVTDVWQGISGFFAGLFGGTASTTPGGFGDGIVVLLVAAGICVLILMIGIVRNSAYRYIWAEATELDKNPRYEARRSLRGRRLQQLGVALVNLLLLSPVLVALYLFFAPREALADVTLRLMDILTGEAALPAVAIPYGKLAVVFFACWLPLAPMRRIITSYFATARLRRLAAPHEQDADNSKEPLPPLYQDMPPQGGRTPR